MNDNSTDKNSTVITTVREIDVREAAAMAEQGVLMLDVREPDEWASGHMVGATHVPLGELDASALPSSAPIVAVCRSGNRSSKAAIELLKAGHDVFNMAGGMKAWQDAGLPVVTDDGKPGTI